MADTAAPIAPGERVYTLDVIRGFALLGIFIMNMPSFGTSFWAGMDGTELFPAAYDRWVEEGRDVLFSGKFNSMFSMLFAVGFTIQLQRLEARDPGHATSIYLRRIFWLFVFGAIHMCIFWTGDVLHLYAAFGLVLLALRRVPDKVLWVLFGLCMVYPVAMGLWRIHSFTAADREYFLAAVGRFIASNDAAYGHGSFLDAAREHLRETWALYSDPPFFRSMLVFAVQVFSTMLLGLIAGRRQFFQDAARHLPRIRRLQWWFLALGLASGAVFGLWDAVTTDRVSPTPFKLFANVCYFVCRVAIMLFYVATIVRCAHSATWRPRLAAIATTGRMPLTNYLLQTAMATTLFYGWGFGLWNQVGPAMGFLLAVALFFLVQVPLSTWWLARHPLGPMEYLWRWLTYGANGVRKVAAAPASG